MPTGFKGILDSEKLWKGTSHTGPDLKAALSARALRGVTTFVRPTYWASSSTNGKQLRRTAYLDGLRGFAAFMVYWLHHQLWAHEDLQMNRAFENAFGWDGHYYFVALPGVRTFFSGGHFAVTVFYVISGYVLSAKPLALIQAGEYVKLSDSVGSSLFRRWLRLFLPVIGTTFVFMSLLHIFNLPTSVLDKAPTYSEEVSKWYKEFNDFAFIFRSGGEPWFTYHFHAWSIPVEFRGSIMIYASIIAFSRCTRDARLLCQLGLIIYFVWITDGWFCGLFSSGMLLCDLDLLAANDNLPRFLSKLRPYKQTIFHTLFIASIYLGGVPSSNADVNNLRDSYGWQYLSYLKPKAMWDYKWFYLTWASTFLVSSVPHISWLKAFFETHFCQYLGRISFAFYLVHGPVLWLVADRLYASVGWTKEWHGSNIPGWINKFPLPKGGPLGLEPSFLAIHLIVLPLTLWLAEVLTKVFDDPSIRISQWLYNKTLAGSEK
ncbi:putative acyltransferase [Talaromyces proteolyticus]|uniref:Acyltransferase n=1 Tax=Talaromyces proteolyticus TaxID=1131652 RepID=A0AAD4KTW1_9EURO|nr:putative acyltransferase [Talaromyces proteolyticus]KAH8698695.1 putative acyltransferase [Talaromyces proteolyticus]